VRDVQNSIHTIPDRGPARTARCFSLCNVRRNQRRIFAQRQILTSALDYNAPYRPKSIEQLTGVA
jgi:hypothetical protein